MCWRKNQARKQSDIRFLEFVCRPVFSKSSIVWRRQMFSGRSGSKIAMIVGIAVAGSVSMAQQDVKITDPTSVVMIVNRDSNDLGFMDIKTKKVIGRVFLGNNVNPHMVMMSPDGRYVVTGGTRANTAYIVDTRTLKLVKVINVDIAPEHLAFSPDSRWY